MTKEVVQKVFLLPDDLLGKDLLVIRLKHPKSDGDILCAIDPSNKLFEIVHFKEDISSWFLKETVSDDGSLFFLTKVDPLFFILPFVNKLPGKYCPIEDMLTDENYPDICYLSKCFTMEELKNIFDFKESGGYKVYCYNKIKTLHWLQQKASILSKKIASQDIDLSDGSKAAFLRSEDNTKSEDEYLKYSCQLLSEYLPTDLSSDLFSAYGIEESPKIEKKTPEKQLKKKSSIVKPEDDYSIKFKTSSAMSKQNAKLTSAQKKLLKVDKSGMKTISSFFKKS